MKPLQIVVGGGVSINRYFEPTFIVKLLQKYKKGQYTYSIKNSKRLLCAWMSAYFMVLFFDISAMVMWMIYSIRKFLRKSTNVLKPILNFSCYMIFSNKVTKLSGQRVLTWSIAKFCDTPNVEALLRQWLQTLYQIKHPHSNCWVINRSSTDAQVEERVDLSHRNYLSTE